MRRLQLTSPGVLLILAAASVATILALDVLYLQPQSVRQKRQAAGEQAARVEAGARAALRGEEASLRQTCAAWAQSGLVLNAISGKPAGGDDSLERMGADIAWLCDARGQLVALWTASPFTAGDKRGGELAGALSAICDPSHPSRSGLLRLPEVGVAMVATADIGSEDSGKAHQLGYLGLARLAGGVSGAIGQAAGADVVFVAGELPRDHTGGVTRGFWMTDDDRLAVAWIAPGMDGQAVGYFRADIAAGELQRQADVSRRLVLIIMSVSLGLVLLVIMAAQMLIAGPVVRLLKRLSELESGGRPAGADLSRDLHGEPLVLARRLESAFVRLAQMSKTDQLTGLANRRHFEQVLECFYHQARRYNRPLSLMAMDVDFFKAVNDTCGHAGGDKLLKLVASALESSCRQADLPARLGGDEFAVLLPETCAADAAMVAGRIAAWLSQNITSLDGLELKVTMSIGIADMNAGEIDSPAAMTELADKALYAAKELGRNRVVQAHDLNGLGLHDGVGHSAEVLCRKLAGLDTQFKDLFLRAVEEIVSLLEKRDPHMADHARKVQHYAVLIARQMELPDRVIKRIQIASMLHDIGMVAMPDSILLNPGELSEQQLQQMRKHPLLSVRIMEGMEFLEQEIPAVRYHHERFDGKGYPEGIAGASIPLTARILSVADCFDAMTSPRAFRGAKSQQQALEELKKASGSQFDPVVIDAFIKAAQAAGEDFSKVVFTEQSLAQMCEVIREDRKAAAAPAPWRTGDPATTPSAPSRDSTNT